MTEIDLKRFTVDQIAEMGSDSDPEAQPGPELGDDFWSRARPMPPMSPTSIERMEALSPSGSSYEDRLLVPVDADVAERFRQGGGDWVARLNAILRRALADADA